MLTSYQTDCDVERALALAASLLAAGYRVELTGNLASRKRPGVQIRTWETTAAPAEVNAIAALCEIPLYGICDLAGSVGVEAPKTAADRG